MRNLFIFGLGAVLVGVISSPLVADEKEARAVLEKAIKAHGGVEELKKLESHSAQFSGTISTNGMDLKFSGEVKAKGSEYFKVTMDLDVNNMNISIINVISKDKGWAKVADNITELDKDQVAEAMQQGHQNAALNLFPLLEKKYKLSVVGEEKVNGKDAICIRVEHPKFRAINICFDKKSYLLVQATSVVKDFQAGEEVTEVTTMTDHEDKGSRQPKKLTITRDGKPYITMEVSSYQLNQKFDDKEFSKPSSDD